eukprot:GSChrysophyteH1.ASY1.ANO1.2428.1 assembled CDS
MDALQAYGDSSSDESEHEISLSSKVMAPRVPDAAMVGLGGRTDTSIYGANELASTATNSNLKIAEMYAPLAGPENPNSVRALNEVRTGIRGTLAKTSVEHETFDAEFRAANKWNKDRNAFVTKDAFKHAAHIKGPPTSVHREKRKYAELNIGDDLDGPWAQPLSVDSKYEADLARVSEKAAKVLQDRGGAGGGSSSSSGSAAANDAAADEEAPRRKIAPSGTESTYDEPSAAAVTAPGGDGLLDDSEITGKQRKNQSSTASAFTVTSKFHGKEEVDYQGRSWTRVPAGLRVSDSPLEEANYIPKKCVKKYSGHHKGIWDVYNDRQVLRSYHGHSEAVRAIDFSNSAVQFLSAGFDKITRLWDTETGQAVGTFSNNKMGYCCKFYPNDNNIFLVACQDKRIYQWDARSQQVTSQYTHHLGPVNSITFYDEGRKFFSTSDDKKIMCWEYEIDVPIRILSEPEMHSVPTCTLHPSANYLACQSMDNSIVVYSCIGEKVKALKKKSFRGHNNSGYACQIGISSNGSYISSGDGFGAVHIWDWKTTRSMCKFQAHDNGPCMGSVWHPAHPSWMATCGWDGLIKLWE